MRWLACKAISTALRAHLGCSAQKVNQVQALCRKYTRKNCRYAIDQHGVGMQPPRKDEE